MQLNSLQVSPAGAKRLFRVTLWVGKVWVLLLPREKKTSLAAGLSCSMDKEDKDTGKGK